MIPVNGNYSLIDSCNRAVCRSQRHRLGWRGGGSVSLSVPGDTDSRGSWGSEGPATPGRQKRAWYDVHGLPEAFSSWQFRRCGFAWCIRRSFTRFAWNRKRNWHSNDYAGCSGFSGKVSTATILQGHRWKGNALAWPTAPEVSYSLLPVLTHFFFKWHSNCFINQHIQIKYYSSHKG